MFEKMKLKNAIKASKKKIEDLEHKRTRSQAALVEAILTHSEPEDSDVDFFNMFTEKINTERENLHRLQEELEKLS